MRIDRLLRITGRFEWAIVATLLLALVLLALGCAVGLVDITWRASGVLHPPGTSIPVQSGNPGQVASLSVQQGQHVTAVSPVSRVRPRSIHDRHGGYSTFSNLDRRIGRRTDSIAGRPVPVVARNERPRANRREHHEMVVISPLDGVVTKVHVSAGAMVHKDEAIASLEPNARERAAAVAVSRPFRVSTVRPSMRSGARFAGPNGADLALPGTVSSVALHHGASGWIAQEAIERLHGDRSVAWISLTGADCPPGLDLKDCVVEIALERVSPISLLFGRLRLDG